MHYFPLMAKTKPQQLLQTDSRIIYSDLNKNVEQPGLQKTCFLKPNPDGFWV